VSGQEGLTEPERIALVEAAAAEAELLETVRGMPNGLDTRIGDRSEENLSDGQVTSQRPGAARRA
jgi:ABC-type multidrug transport system fused ATPase/permease subunit